MSKGVINLLSILAIFSIVLSVGMCSYVCIDNTVMSHGHKMVSFGTNLDHVYSLTLATVSSIVLTVSVALLFVGYSTTNLELLQSLVFAYIFDEPVEKKRAKRQFFSPRSPPLY